MNENKLVRLETKRLVLRDLKRGDEDSIVKYANSLKISQYMSMLPFPYTRADADKWINSCLANQAKEDRADFCLAITFKENDKLVGSIGLSKLDRQMGTASMGYWLGEEYWRNGVMQEAATAMLVFAFDELALRRLDICAVTENVASNALIRKLGFQYEGMQRKKHVSKATGLAQDLNIYGMLREEFELVKNKQ